MKNRHRDWVRSLYDQYAPDLYRLARHRLRDPDLAHDLVQEVFLTLVAKADQVRDHPKPIAWLLKTMEYKLLQEFDRQEKKRKREAPDTDLTWLGGAPHGLTQVLGVRATELDALHPQDSNALVLLDGRRFRISELCELSADLGAQTLGSYERDFYAGMPCLTRNEYGQGQAYYLAAKVEQSGLNAIYADIVSALGIPRALKDELPEGVVATERGGAVFLQNYSGKAQRVTLSATYTDLITGKTVGGEFDFPACGVMVLMQQ